MKSYNRDGQQIHNKTTLCAKQEEFRRLLDMYYKVIVIVTITNTNKSK